MRIVIFNWRDLTHPKAGGAEYSTHTLASGLASRGHQVTWFTSRTSGNAHREDRNGYEVVRRGSEISCRFAALSWLIRNRKRVDVIVDEVNTLPFFTPFVSKRVVLWIHQIAKEVWLNEAPRGLRRLGLFSEPLLMAAYRGRTTVTVSNSSAKSLSEIGLAHRVHVIENALRAPADGEFVPVHGRIGYIGRVTPSKRVHDIIIALSYVRTKIHSAHLIIVGAGEHRYMEQLRALASALDMADAVAFTGRVPDDARDRIMSSLDVLSMASVREGWGLVVSEAARFGVPSAVYPVAGLVDSVVDGVTGIVAQDESPDALGRALCELISNRSLRTRMGISARHYIASYTTDRFVDRFERILQSVAETQAGAIGLG